MVDKISALCEAKGVSLVYLFGSQALGGVACACGDVIVPTDDLFVDLDVGVVMQGSLPPASERHRLYSVLHNAFQDCFPCYRVDLVFLQENHSVFQYEAIKGTCLYQASQEVRGEYEMRVLRLAADFRPVLNMFLTEVLEEVSV